MAGAIAGAGLRGLKLSRPPFPTGWSSIPLSLANLNLSNTLPVGQSFLWHRHWLADASEEYSRAVDNPPRVICLRQSPTELYYTAIYPTPEAAAADEASGLTRAWLEDYFQLDRYPDLTTLYEDWRSRDSAFFSKIELDQRTVGVRVLRQDPWECLVAFITSTNNHIPRITSLLHRFSEQFSEPLITLENPDGVDDTTYYLFPRPEDIPDADLENVLRGLGFGYRAGFLQSSFQTLRSKSQEGVAKELLRWRTLPVEEARQLLVELKGVGRKVADCVLLMSMDQPHVIPVDTHIYSIATRHPALPSRLSKKVWSSAIYEDVQAFLSEAWGPLGGWTQAVVFASDLRPQTPRKVKVKTESPPRSKPAKRSSVDLLQDSPPPLLKRTRSATKVANGKLKNEASIPVVPKLELP